MPQETITHHAMQNAMHEAAARLLMCEPARRAYWIAYLLECLDSNASLQDDSDFRAQLRAVRDAINIRLEEGRW